MRARVILGVGKGVMVRECMGVLIEGSKRGSTLTQYIFMLVLACIHYHPTIVRYQWLLTWYLVPAVSGQLLEALWVVEPALAID